MPTAKGTKRPRKLGKYYIENLTKDDCLWCSKKVSAASQHQPFVVVHVIKLITNALSNVKAWSAQGLTESVVILPFLSLNRCIIRIVIIMMMLSATMMSGSGCDTSDQEK